ncbi:hypothetical protein CspeluHIS016_0600380 [Cutaneotrichosporon spelunceum]|uniref:Uncharacterized protein n=1 Tax=Cutaneotrichosporon spelunceum TaxID=1672016 RepID=A0AAD3YD02_9TREE|nr:hypothetical protein CspeluHIS016_0600380 [Cutaneotrichosporon spelunceum]
MPITTQRRRRWVEAAALLLAPLSLAAHVPYSHTAYAASAQCTIKGSSWILYLGDRTAPYAWDAAANPDGAAFRERTQQMHLLTAAPDQSITCRLHGTGINVFGGLRLPGDVNLTDSTSLNITLDGQPLKPDAMTLTQSGDTWKSTILQVPAVGGAPLTNEMHTLQIQTGPRFNGSFQVWGMTGNSTISTDGWTPYSTMDVGSSTGNELPFVFNSSVASTMYNWKDQDPGVHDLGLQNVETPEVAVSVRRKAEATVNLPNNSSYLVVHGYSGPNYGKLFLDIDPAPPGVSNLPVQIDTNKPWLIYDSFFETPLDPTTNKYTVTFTTKDGELGAGVYLASTNVLEYTENALNPFTGGWADGTKPQKKNVGAVIGGAVGGVVGGLLLIGLLIFLWRRHSAAKKAKAAIMSAEECSLEGTEVESDGIPEKDGSARASLRPPSMAGRPQSGVASHRKSEMSLMLERDKRKSTMSTKSSKSARQSRHQSQMPGLMLAGDYRKEVENWLLPSGAYSGGALRQSRPVSSVSGRGLLDGLTVPSQPMPSRPVSSVSGRGLLDGLSVPPNPRHSRPVSSTSGRGLLDGLNGPPPGAHPLPSAPAPPTLDTSVAVPGSPQANLSPVEQTMVTLTSRSAQSPQSVAASLPADTAESTPAPLAAVQATAAGPPVSLPSAATPASTAIAGAPARVDPSPPQPGSGRESAMSQADSFVSLPDESEADAANTTVGSEGFSSGQSHDTPASAFLQPNSSRARPPSRLPISKTGEGKTEQMEATSVVDETEYTPGTAM